MNTKLKYTDADGVDRPYPLTGEGYAEPATEDDEKRDKLGFTHPNLHRRIASSTTTGPDEVSPRRYQLMVQNVNSYRTTTTYLHNENSTDVEIP